MKRREHTQPGRNLRLPDFVPVQSTSTTRLSGSGSSSPKIKRSSIFACRAFAISWASLSEGLYFPCSRKTIVSRRTRLFLRGRPGLRNILPGILLSSFAQGFTLSRILSFSIDIAFPEKNRLVDYGGERK